MATIQSARPIRGRYRPLPIVILVPRLVVLISVLFYAVLIPTLYQFRIAPIYTYAGYGFRPSGDVLLFATALVLALLPAAVLPLTWCRPGSVLLWVLYLLVYVPSQVIPPQSTGGDSSLLLPLQLSLFVAMVLLMVANFFPTIAIRIVIPPVAFYSGFGVLYTLIFFVLVRYLGIPKQLPTFAEVYDHRYEMMATMEALPRVGSYFYPWFHQVLNPLLILFGLATRRWLFLAMGILGQLYVYGLSGDKVALFVVPLILVLVFLVSVPARMASAIMTLGGVGLILVALLFDKLVGTVWFTALLIQRLIITPGLLTGYYHQFFSENPRVLFAESFTQPLLDSPYDTTIPYVIGEVYFYNPRILANGNLWADGTANLGLLGIFLVTLVACAIVWIFNCLQIGRNGALVRVMAGVSAYAFVNTALSTSLLTHGVALAILILAVSPSSFGATGREKVQSKKDRR